MASQFFLVTFFVLSSCIQSSTAYMNVLGNALESCSQDNMALTGYTRTGLCVDQNDDQGSHHICIDLSSANGGNFCDVTGQNDWCSSEMPCQEDQNEYCQVQNWCVCQWAFASYLENAGGCDMIQDVVCDAVNLEALVSYRRRKGTTKYDNALECIVNRCGVDSSLYQQSATAWLISGVVVIITLVAGAYIWHKFHRRTVNNPSFQQDLVPENVVGASYQTPTKIY